MNEHQQLTKNIKPLADSAIFKGVTLDEICNGLIGSLSKMPNVSYTLRWRYWKQNGRENMTEIECISYSSIHMTLVDMNGNLARSHMNFGVKLTNPTWTIRIRKCKKKISIVWTSELANRSQDILNIVEKFEKQTQINTSKIEIIISEGIPAHIGLGSTTLLFIGLIKSLAKYFNHSISESDTVKLSKKGGVSGLCFIFNYLEKNGLVLNRGKIVPHFENDSSVKKDLRSKILNSDNNEKPKKINQ